MLSKQFLTHCVIHEETVQICDQFCQGFGVLCDFFKVQFFQVDLLAQRMRRATQQRLRHVTRKSGQSKNQESAQSSFAPLTVLLAQFRVVETKGHHSRQTEQNRICSKKPAGWKMAGKNAALPGRPTKPQV